MKKFVIALLGLSFGFAVSSCGEHATKKPKVEKECIEKQERHHDRW